LLHFLIVMLSVIMLSIIMQGMYEECHYAECRGACFKPKDFFCNNLNFAKNHKI